jgi:hypothetical protein
MKNISNEFNSMEIKEINIEVLGTYYALFFSEMDDILEIDHIPDQMLMYMADENNEFGIIK